VFGLGSEPRSRPPSYNGTPTESLWRPLVRRLIPLAATLAIALAAAACSFSYKLESLFDRDGDKSDVTGSTARPTQTAADPAVLLPPEADLALAKVAATEALARDGKDVSVAWEKPKTGAHGTVTPLAAAYTQDGFVCRGFLASHVRGGSESWLQGEACRIHQGRWEVRHIKPWNRS
jgi:hypothetical protein